MPDYHYVRYFVSDYRRDTGRLSQAEHGAYHLLIDEYYAFGEPLPDDDEILCRISLCADMAAWMKVRPKMAAFFQVGDGVWRHKRCDEEIATAKAFISAKVEGGRLGAERRWGKNGSADGLPNGSPSSTPTSDPVTDPIASESESRAVTESKTESRAIKVKSGGAAQTTLGTRLPEDWSLPDEWAEWGRKARPDLDIVLVGQIFADYWHAKPGKDGRKTKWEATWRNFVRSQKAFPVKVQRDLTAAEVRSVADTQRANEVIQRKKREEVERKRQADDRSRQEEEERVRRATRWMLEQSEEVQADIRSTARSTFRLLVDVAFERMGMVTAR